jgi:plasmid stabilization system protein ParE
MRVRYTVPAQNDLDQVYTYISKENLFAAERVKRQIKTDIEKHGELPRSGDIPIGSSTLSAVTKY